MLESQYTVRDSPATVARIEGDLRLIVDEVRRADPFAESLILTGGFARGEGALLDGVPQNDYDLVAVRGLGRPRRPYEEVRSRLEDRLGLHIDLATIQRWRLRWVAKTIFWYETALAGRVLWGRNVLHRIPVTSPGHLRRTEGLRLLVNRAAGLLLVAEVREAGARLVQASKALLAVADVHLLARGEFPPSQRERWDRLRALRGAGQAAPDVERLGAWLEWAYRFKVDPQDAPARDPEEAWRAAANALLDAVPVGLEHAGLASLDDYAARDGLADHVTYLARARRFAWNPTGRVRVATLRILEASQDGRVRPESFREFLDGLAPDGLEGAAALGRVRALTLQ